MAILEQNLEIVGRKNLEALNASLGRINPIKAQSVYLCRHLERFALGTSYVEIVTRVRSMMMSTQLRDETALLVDQTGVGRPVMDIMRDQGLIPLGVTIHGGLELTASGDGYHVPKRQLVSALRLLYESGRIRISPKLEYAKALNDELPTFTMKLSQRTGFDSYEGWRDRDKDDLVLALAIAAWYASYTQPYEKVLADLKPARKDWDPLAWADEGEEELPFNPMQYPTRRN